MTISDLGMIFQFVGGLGLFLYGMNAMADGLQKSAGHRMQHLLGILTANRLLGVLVGAGVTAIIQSSSATTVMIVGFVNAGIINLTQAVGIIMGANIGTTITSWIVSMNEWSELMKPEFFAPLIVGAGAIIALFSKSEKKKQIGEIFVGIGILFIGLTFMSGAIKPYRDAPIFAQTFAVLGRNPFLGILAGAGVTAIIQSSSASVGILQTLALNGVVNWQSAIYITLGQNIGTCVTALISSIGAHKTAKRAAVIHLIFNVAGAVIFGVLMFALFTARPDFATSSINSVEISVFHTIFNVGNTLLLFPFANYLVKLSSQLIKDNKEEVVEEELLCHLDERILETPSFAIETVVHEVTNMGQAALENLYLAASALMDNDSKKVSLVFENEKQINRYEKGLMEYLIKINHLALNEEQHVIVKNLFYTINDIERISDHCENLAELSEEKINGNLLFSDTATSELEEIIKATSMAVEFAIKSRQTGEMSDVRRVVFFEEQVDNLEEELRESHLMRLSKKSCNTESSIIFLDAISNLERISDHAHNIAGYVREEL